MFLLDFRIPKWSKLERPSGGPLVQPLLSRGTQSNTAQDYIQVAFEDLQNWRLHGLSGQPVPVLHHLHSMEVLPGVWLGPPVFQLVPGAVCPGAGHHWKEPGSVLFAPSLLVFVHVDKIPFSLPCPWLNSRGSQPLPTEGMFQTFGQFCSPLLDSFQYVQVCLVLGAQNQTQRSRCH